MIQIRKEDNQKKQKEKKLKVYKVNTHKKTVIALWVLLAMSFLFAVYKNFTAIDIHTVHETKVIEETILDTHKIENFVENFAEVYYSWEQSAASIDNRTNALKGYLTGELQALNVDTVRKDIPVSSALLWSSIFVTLMANKIGGLQFGIYRNCQISSRVFHTAVAALPLTKANRSDFE